jgi:hypothetical protein
MQDSALATEFHVMIEYRTKCRLAVWSGMVPAANTEQADEIAEKSVRRHSRAVVRVDRPVVR